MIRRVGFSLKYKFIVVISLLLLLTMGFYLKYALNIFKEDKAADVYSITLSNAVSMAERTKLLINQDLSLFESLKDSSSLNESLFKNNSDIYLAACNISGNINSVLNNEKLKSENLDPELISSTNFSESFHNVTSTISLRSNSIAGLPPHYLLLKKISDSKECLIAVSIGKLLVLSNETLNYGSYILSSTGKIFLKINNNVSKNIEQDMLANQKVVKESAQGTVKLNNIIKAFAKIDDYNLIAVSEIPEDKAFMASALLVNKSLYFGILILSISVILGILFTKRMTSNLNELFLATGELAKGNFKIDLKLKGNDEIAALSDSFIDMKDKIVDYMDQMKEKARIENEVRLAKMVQDSFFPKDSIIGNGYLIKGLYRPATECSGDWWGYFEQEKKLTLIICDATGHGVSAALITASAHSVLTNLKIESEKNYFSPKQVLSKLNKVISELNSEIMMTAFVLEIDREKNIITYANSSHMGPYLIRKVDGSYSKDNIIPLVENNGARIGEKSNTRYEESQIEIISGDKVVLFSDGILEASKDGKMYGQRNFIKNLIASCNEDASKLISNVMIDLKDYVIEDDISLINVDIVPKFQEIITSEDKIKGQIAFSKLENQKNIELLVRSDVNHLIGYNGKNEILEMSFIEDLSSDFEYDLTHQFKNKKKYTLTNNQEIKNTISHVIQFLEGQFDNAITNEQITLVLEELLSNAFYHSNKQSPIKRNVEVHLSEDKSIELLCLFNLDYLMFSIKGPGKFSRENILGSIKRGYETKSPISGEYGAGLGLYLVYDNVSQLWFVNNDFEEKTQIVTVMENFNRNKKSKERVTSFHFINWEKV